MKHTFLPALFSLLICSEGCKKCPVNEFTISAITYNVAGLPEGLSSSHPALYSASISPLLNDYAVVHLQEDFCYHDSILLYNTHPYKTETLGCVPVGDGLNALADFLISNVERFAWTDHTFPNSLTPKGFSHTEIAVAGGENIDFYNVHCNAGGAADDMLARRSNIAQLCTHIQQHSTGKAVIIMGDFNSRYTRDGDTIRALLDMGFKDVWVELIRAGSVPEISPDRLDDCDSVRTSMVCERVDKLFYRGSAQFEITPLSYQVDDPRFYYQGNDTIQLSDHWPVFTSFRIKKIM